MPRSVRETTPRGHPGKKRKHPVVTTVHPSGKITGGTKKSRANARAARVRVRRVTAPRTPHIPRVPSAELPVAVQSARLGGGTPTERQARSLYGEAGRKAIHHAHRQYVIKNVEQGGLKEDPLAEFAIDTLATAGVGGVVGAVAKRAGAAAIEAGATKAVTSPVTNIGESATEKGVKAALKKVKGAVKKAPSKTKVKVRRAPKATKEAVKRQKPSRAGTVRAASKVRRHPARAAGAGQAVPLPYGANQTDVGKRVQNFVKGNWEAATSDPLKYLDTTRRALPGFVTVPAKIAAEAGVTVGRAASTVAHEAHVPGAAGYSAHEISGGLTKEASMQKKGFEDFLSKEFAKSPKTVKKAALEDYGAVPFAAAVPLGKAIGKVSKGRLVKLPARRAAERIREHRGKEHGGEPKVFENKAQRGGVSRIVARATTGARSETAARAREVKKEGQKAGGGESMLLRAMPKGKRGVHEVRLHDADMANILIRNGIDASHPDALKRIEDTLVSLRDPNEIGLTLDPSKPHSRDVLTYALTHEEKVRAKHLLALLEAYRAQGKHARENPVLNPEGSERARLLPVANTAGIAYPEHRVYPGERMSWVDKSGKRHEIKTWEEHGLAHAATAEGRRAHIAQLKREIKTAESGRKEAQRVNATIDRRMGKRAGVPTNAPAADLHIGDRIVLDGKHWKRITSVRRDERLPAHGTEDFPNHALRIRFSDGTGAILREADGVKVIRGAGKKMTKSLLKAKADAVAVQTKARKVVKQKREEISRANQEIAIMEREAKRADLAAKGRQPSARLSADERASLREKAIADAGPNATAGQLKRVVRAAYKDARDAKTKSEQDAAFKEFQSEVNAHIEKTPGLVQPEWTPTNTASGGVDISTGSNFSNLPGKSKFREGTADLYGLTDESFSNLLRKGIAAPVARRWIYGAVRDIRRKYRETHQGRTEFKIEEAKKLFRGDETTAPAFNPRTHMAMPVQTIKRVDDVLKAKVSELEAHPQEYADAIAEVKRIIAQQDKNKEAMPEIGGRTVEIWKREALIELESQLEHRVGKIVHTGMNINRVTSFMILGTSPAWAMMQIPAEYGQASLQHARLLNPEWVRSSIKAYEKIPAHKRQAAEASTGTLHRVMEGERDWLQLASDTAEGEIATGYGVFHRTWLGNTVRHIPQSIRAIDNFKGGRIRLLTGLAHIDELNGPMNHFLKGIGGLDRDMARILDETKGMSKTQRYEYFIDHPQLLEKVGRNVDESLGNWSALTRYERPAALIGIFYPFVRMSLRWIFHDFPKNHPIRFAVSAYLAQNNSVELKKLLHGEPSFFTQWGMTPFYTGGDTQIMDLSRIAPGSNALIEALGGGQGPWLGGFLRGTQPIISAGVTGVTGVDPLSGQQEPHSGIQMGNQLINLSPIARNAEAALTSAQGYVRSDAGLKLVGSKDKQEALDKLLGKLKGSVTEQYARSFAVPFLPQPVDRVRDSAIVGRALKILSQTGTDAHHKLEQTPGSTHKQSETMWRDYGKAQDILNGLYKKYKIPYKKETAAFLAHEHKVRYGPPKVSPPSYVPNTSSGSGGSYFPSKSGGGTYFP